MSPGWVPFGNGIDTAGPVVDTVAPTPANAIRGPTIVVLGEPSGRDHVVVEFRTRTGCCEYVYETSASKVGSAHETVLPDDTGAMVPVHTSVEPSRSVRTTRYLASSPPEVKTRCQLRTARADTRPAVITGATLGTNVAPVNVLAEPLSSAV